MTQDELRELGINIAESLVEISLRSGGDEWKNIDRDDHLMGELARYLTLKNLYLDRQEYEKCTAVQIKINNLNRQLDIKEEDYDGDQVEEGEE